MYLDQQMWLIEQLENNPDFEFEDLYQILESYNYRDKVYGSLKIFQDLSLKNRGDEYDRKVKFLAEALSDITGACEQNQCSFKTVTVNSWSQIGTDCIDVFWHSQQPGITLGVYHQMDPDQIGFSLYLGYSRDGLNDWFTITRLEKDASQGKVWLNPNGTDVLLAYETADGFGGNFVAIKHYKDLFQLVNANAHDQISFERRLAPISEGTPSFESV